MVKSNVVSVTASVPPPPPGMGTLMLDTTPVKGELFMNTVFVGVAPILVHVVPGVYTVSFGRVPGYLVPSAQTVPVAEGAIVPVMGIYEVVTVPRWIPYAILGGGVGVLAIAALNMRE